MPNNLVFNYSAQQLKVLTNGVDSQGNIQPLSVSDSGALNIGAISGDVGVIATDLDIRSLSGATDSIAIAGNVGVVATDLDIRDLSAATDSITVVASGLDIRSLSGATDSVAIAGDVGIVATDLDIRDLSGVTDSVTVFATDLDIRSLSGATDSVTIAGNVGVVATDLDIRDLSGVTDSVTVFATDLDIRSLSGATDSVTIAGDVGIVATDLDIRDLSGATDSITVAGFTYESTLETLAFTDGQTQTTESKLVGGVSFMTYYISNTGVGTLTIIYEISPIDTDDYYIKDSLVNEFTVNPSEKITIIQGTYSTYGRLSITCTGGASNVEVYYMSRS